VFLEKEQPMIIYVHDLDGESLFCYEATQPPNLDNFIVCEAEEYVVCDVKWRVVRRSEFGQNGNIVSGVDAYVKKVET